MKGGPITPREVDTSFISELVRLWVRTFEEAYAGEHTPENIKAYCNTHFTEPLATAALIDPKTSCKVAFRASTPIGFTLMRHQEAHYLLPKTAAELKQIYLISKEFGAGTGSHLLHDAMSAALAADHRWLWLLVSNRNLRACAFYKKFNFRILGEGQAIQVGSDTLQSFILARRI